MVFGTRHFLDKFDNVNVMYNGDFIENVESFKYLGAGLPTFRNCLEGETSRMKRKNPRVGSRLA